jgi:hypothetical protein
MRNILLALCLMITPLHAQDVEDITPQPGWEVHVTPHDYGTLVDRTRAGPTGAAANRGITIPGNTVIGAFNNAYAVRIQRLSTAAMIHAPIRLYVTENADGTASLSYIRPTHLLAPYMEGAEPDLATAATELDEIFAAIASAAIAR